MANQVDIVIKAVDKASGEINKVTGAGNKLSSGFQSLTGISLGAAGAMAAVGVAVAKAAEYSREAINAASDLSETTTKVGVVFGEQSEAMINWGKSAAEAMGMSSNAALAAAGTYGNLFRAMGITEQVSSEMSQTLVQLASDLASFNNMNPEEVLDKLRAGLSGEVEPLRSLGVNLNQVLIEQEALNLGIWDGVDALTAAQKAQASYSLILKQTSLAQGDFNRTSEGLANQQRINAALAEDLKASIGENLLPVKIKWLNMVNDFTKATYELVESKNREKRILEAESESIEKHNDRFAELMEYYASIGIYAGEAYDLTMDNIRANEAWTARLEAEAEAYGIATDATNEMTESQQNLLDVTQLLQESLKKSDWAEGWTGASDEAKKLDLQLDYIRDNLGQLGAAGGEVWNAFLLQTGRITPEALTEFANVEAAFLRLKGLLASGIPVTVAVSIVTSEFNIGGSSKPSAPRAGDWALKGTKGGVGTESAWWSESLGQWYYGDSPNQATGGIGGGWTKVGERGEEIVNLPAGSRVYSNTQTNQLTGGAVEVDYDKLGRVVGKYVGYTLAQMGLL